MTTQSALIFDIVKFAVHDGPGIRTVVFIKGCPLHCRWCHNPESQSPQNELFFSREKCIKCGWCVSVCPKKCHSIENRQHVFDRKKCILCGKCTEKCFSDALEIVGRTMNVDEIMKTVMKDHVFFKKSGGGLTLSGGEPLSHFKFTKDLLAKAKEENLHTAVETSGFAPTEQILELIPLVDLWLWDIKASPEKHRELTGVDADLILFNLSQVDKAGAKIFLRCPLIPGINDEKEEIIRIAKLANSLKGCQQIDIEPYHPLGENKAIRLGRSNIFHADFTEKTKIEEYLKIFRLHTSINVSTP